MLVLSRREYESVRIGNAIVTVTSINGNRVLLGIEAPADVPVRRTEKDDDRTTRGKSA